MDQATINKVKTGIRVFGALVGAVVVAGLVYSFCH